MKVLVTGSAGFLGSHLTDSLIEQGHKVYGIDNLSGGYARNVNNTSEFYPYNCQDKICRELIRRLKPEVLYYLAADATEGRSQFTPVSATENNLMAYVNCLTACIRAGVKKVIFTSSMSAYGNQKPPFSEDMERKPVDVYGVNKVASERITEILSGVHGFNYTIIRPHNVFGERQNISDPYRNVIGIWMNCIMYGKSPVIYGDGRQRRAFTYVDNFTPYFVKAGFQENCNGEIINIGPVKDYSINEACGIVLEAMRSDLKPIYKRDRPVEVKYAYSTVAKAERLLGYKTTVTFEEGIKRMAKWAKELGPQPFKYLSEMEITSKEIPTTWRNKTL